MEWKYSKLTPIIKENIIIINYKDIDKNYQYKIPIKIKDGLINCNLNIKMLKKNIINNEYSSLSVNYSNNSKSHKYLLKNNNYITIKEYIDYLDRNDEEYKYIFHGIIDNFCNILLKDINLNNYIINPNLSKSCFFYIGNIFTGTHLHKHSKALNFLIYGKKLWVIIPPTNRNKKLIKENNWSYSNMKGNVHDFYEKNINNILKNFNNVFITYQNSGEIIFIPKNYYHLVLNFSENIGFTYSYNT